MKRFYCTICKQVKRVRRLPAILDVERNHVNPTDRIGECDKHSQPRNKTLTFAETLKKHWTPENIAQADARMNRTNSKVRKVR